MEIFTNKDAILIRAYQENKKDESTAIVRYIDDFGRIVIPKETRIAFDIKPYDKFDISVDNEYIYLTKSYDKCVFCGAAENLSLFGEKPICKNCINGIKKL
ncbi:hypothetical protein SDC9_163747 [bioreactor metagenome]|uniref:SpoVT-AbrB domain-containing protein n=1 Tax=bioreactor metagenome TaxID=1076179 RepID=A0A645FPR1_9ZZZZ